MKAGPIIVTETSLQRSPLTELDPRPLFSLVSRRVHAEEKHLHTLLARNFHKLDRIIRGEIEVQLTKVRTDFQGTNETTIDGDSQFLRLVLARLTDRKSKRLD